MPPFTEGNVRRIMINPFYAITITVAPRLTQEHEPAVDEAEWVLANATLIEAMGAERWLRLLLDVLEGKAGAATGLADPTEAVNIDPLFSTEHPPSIGRDMWVAVNARLMGEMGVQGWLKQLLDVLAGDVVTAEEVGFTAPNARRGGSRPAREKKGRRKKRRRR